MAKIKIVTDSVCDIPQALLDQWNISVIPCYVNYGGRSYLDDGKELDRAGFWQDIAKFTEYPTTSAPAPGLAEEILTAAFQGYDHLIGIHVPAALSSTFNNIRAGAKNLPQDRVTFADSQTLTMGLGMQVLVAAEVAQNTGNVQDVLNAIEKVRKYQKLYATLYSLDALKRSGRVNPFVASIGTLLQIKPIIEVDNSIVHPIARVRTFGKAVDYLYDLVIKQTPLDRLVVLHIQNENGAKEFLERLGNHAPSDTQIIEVGPTLGTHIGMGSVGAMTLSQQWKA
jgi:DegV family protein with EDD domain